jgi:hypothetical protein
MVHPVVVGNNVLNSLGDIEENYGKLWWMNELGDI